MSTRFLLSERSRSEHSILTSERKETRIVSWLFFASSLFYSHQIPACRFCFPSHLFSTLIRRNAHYHFYPRPPNAFNRLNIFLRQLTIHSANVKSNEDRTRPSAREALFLARNFNTRALQRHTLHLWVRESVTLLRGKYSFATGKVRGLRLPGIEAGNENKS